jgi:hypothetical protein
MQEFYRYPHLLRYGSSFIEHFARTFLAGCVKAIKLLLGGNPSRGVSAPIVDRKRFRYGDDCHFGVQGLCQANPMLNAFSRDIRSVRTQENIGVHLGTPSLVEHCPEKSSLLIVDRRRPSTADLEAISWINEREVAARTQLTEAVF